MLGEHKAAYNQLLNKDSLADTSTAEQADLTSTGVGSEQIDDLDTGDQDFGSGGLLNKLGGRSVDGSQLSALNGASLIDRVTGDVHDTTKGGGADGDLNGVASILSLAASNKTLGTCTNTSEGVLSSRSDAILTVHGNTSDDILTQMLL